MYTMTYFKIKFKITRKFLYSSFRNLIKIHYFEYETSNMKGLIIRIVDGDNIL